MGNVFQGLIRPVPSVMDRMGQLEQMDASALRRRMGEAEMAQQAHAQQLAAQERERLMQTRNAFEGLVRQSGGDMGKLIPALEASGSQDLWAQAQAMKKAQLEAEAKRAEVASRDATTAKTTQETEAQKRRRAIQEMAAFTNPADAAESLNAAVRRGELPMQQAQMLLKNIPQDPAQFNRWQVQTLAAMAMADPSKAVEMRMPKTVQRDTGAAVETVAIDPISGVPSVTGSVQKQVSPDVQFKGPGKYAAGARPAGGSGAGGGAGGGVGGPAAPASGLGVLGLPVPAVAPWANQTTDKDRNKVKASEAARGGKEVEKDEEAARAAGTLARDAQRFMALNAEVATGGISDKLTLTRAAQTAFSSKREEMEAITARLVPAMRQPGSGATSDFDAKMFERGTVGLDKKREANDAIASGFVAASRNLQEYATFRQMYLEQNGTLQGADRFWKQYLNANPIFDPKSEAPKINASRQDWREFFAANAGANAGGRQPPASANSPKPAPAGAPRTVDFGDLK